MKIIHTADIHLGAKINNFPKEVSAARKEEVRSSFKRLIDYANQNEIKVILISGDLFESDKPLVKDKEFFYSVVENNPQIDFIYLHGNHDIVFDEKKYDNLKLFSDTWGSFSYDSVVISSIEMTSKNYSSLYSTLSLDIDKYNIVMLHGKVDTSEGLYNIVLSKLQNKNIDYLALGHYHSYMQGKIDERGEYAYSGCLEGRGYDELGEKGFVLIDTDNNKKTFIPFSQRTINLIKADITGLTDIYSIYLRAKSIGGFSKNDIYRIELIGEIDRVIDGLELELQKFLLNDTKYSDVKDHTKKKIDISKYEADLSIRGEFIREVYNDNSLSEEDKLKIISYGLKALLNGEVE